MKRQLRDRKTEHFKALTTNCHESAIADHVFLTNHSIKWDHFEVTGRSDIHCNFFSLALFCHHNNNNYTKLREHKLNIYAQKRY